jgi:5-methylcytosine-specific restriction endonuclease McrA
MKTKQKRDRRARLLKKNGSRCYLCHKTFLANQLTLDHLKPSSRGGSNKLENLRLACFPCNNRRSDRLERANQSPKSSVRSRLQTTHNENRSSRSPLELTITEHHLSDPIDNPRTTEFE